MDERRISLRLCLWASVALGVLGAVRLSAADGEGSGDAPYRESLQAYSRYLLEPDPEEQAKALERALENDDGSAYLRVELASMALEQDRDVDLALALAEKAVELDPGSVEGHTLLARIHGRLAEMGGPRQPQHLDRAIHHLEALTEIPESGASSRDEHWRLLADLYELRMRLSPETARDSLERALEAWTHVSDERDAAVHSVYILEQLDRRDEAIEMLRGQLAETPGWLRGRRHLADLLEAAGAFPEAVEQFRLILEEDEEDLRTRIRLGRALDRTGKPEEALAAYEQVLGSDPPEEVRSIALFLSADALERLQDYAEAEARYRKWLERNQGSPDARFELARFLESRGRSAEAREQMRLLEESYAGDELMQQRLLLKCSELYASLGQLDRSIEMLEAGLSSTPDDPAVALALIEAYSLAGEHRKAEKLAGRKRRQLDRPGTFWLLEGQAQLLRGDVEGGRRTLEEYLASKKATSRDFSLVADAFGAAGYPELAVEFLDRAIANAPSESERLGYQLRKASAWVQAGRRVRAERLLESLTDSGSHSLEIGFAYARGILIPGERWDELLHLVRRLQSENPDIRTLSLWEVQALIGLQRYSEASQVVERIAGATPEDETYQALHVEIAARNGRKGEALRRAREIAGEPGSDLTTLLLLADRLRDAEAFQEALDLLSVSAGPFEGNARLEFTRGVLHERLGSVDEAVAHFRRAIELDPVLHSAMNYLGYTLAENDGDLREAREWIEKALLLEPNNPAYLDSLGWTLLLMGRHEAAAPHLEKAASMVPEDPVVRMHLARLREEQSRKDEALEGYLEALRQGLDERVAETKERVRGLQSATEPAAP